MKKLAWMFILVLAMQLGVVIDRTFRTIQDPSLPSITVPAETDVKPPLVDQNSGVERSGKVLLRFIDFYYGKDWVANLKMINDTMLPVVYVGNALGKYKDGFDYCTLAVRRVEPIAKNDPRMIENFTIKVPDGCYYGTYFGLKTLNPGEMVSLSVHESDVRSMLGLKDKNLDTIAQVGFEAFVGEDKQRIIVWSEEITFPYDELR